jgi:hypothetical protein
MISLTIETYNIKKKFNFNFFIEINSSNQQQSFKCPYCTDEFLQITHLHLHTTQCHPEQTENLSSCLHCNAVFTNKVCLEIFKKKILHVDFFYI